MAVLAAALAARVPETRPTFDPNAAAVNLLHRVALRPGFGLFCGVAAMSGFLAFATLQARAVGVEAWSVVLLIFGTPVVFVRLVLAKLPDRVPPLRLAAAALGTAATGFVVMGALRTPAGLVTGAVILTVAGIKGASASQRAPGRPTLETDHPRYAERCLDAVTQKWMLIVGALVAVAVFVLLVVYGPGGSGGGSGGGY